MSKAFIVAAVFAAVAVTLVLAKPPTLSTVRDGRNVQVQRCKGADCSGTCDTIVEFKAGQCHNDRRIFSRGEILRCNSVPAKRKCFRENVHDNRRQEGCQGRLVESNPRECGVCTQDVFPLGTFMKFTGCGTPNMTVSRDCDWGCRNCGVQFPVSPNKCMIFRQHSKFMDFAFQNGPEFDCGGSGWTEIQADHFSSPVCDGQPDFTDSVLVDMCYSQFGHGMKFTCA